jgi:hypothetical protein
MLQEPIPKNIADNGHRDDFYLEKKQLFHGDTKDKTTKRTPK